MPLSYVERQQLERERQAKLAEQQEQRRQQLEAHQQLEAERRQAQAVKEAERQAQYEEILARREAVATGEIKPAAVSDGTIRSLFTGHYAAQDEVRRVEEKAARQQERENPSWFTRSMPMPPHSKFAREQRLRIVNPDDYTG